MISNLPTYSSDGEHLDSFKFFVIVRNAAVNTYVQVLSGRMSLFLSGIYRGVVSLGRPHGKSVFKLIDFEECYIAQERREHENSLQKPQERTRLFYCLPTWPSCYGKCE